MIAVTVHSVHQKFKKNVSVFGLYVFYFSISSEKNANSPSVVVLPG